MTIVASDPVNALFLLAVILIILWFVSYSAARSAAGDIARHPHFAADVRATPDAVRFSLANLGSSPAFMVSVSWLDDPGRTPVATTTFLGALRPLEWEVPVAAVPDEAWSMRTLSIRWKATPSASVSTKASLADVLAPARLGVPETDADPAF